MSYLLTADIYAATKDGLTIYELLNLLDKRLSIEAAQVSFDFSSINLNSYGRSGWSTANVAQSSTGFNVTLTHTDGASITATYLESGQSWGNGYEVLQVKLQDHGDELMVDFVSQANTIQTGTHIDILNVSTRAITFSSASSPEKNLSYSLGDVWRYTKDASGPAYAWTQGINQNFLDYQHNGITVTFTDRDASSGTSAVFTVGNEVDHITRNYADVGYAFSNVNTGFLLSFELHFDVAVGQADPVYILSDLKIENPQWRLGLRHGDLVLHANQPSDFPDIGLIIPGKNGVAVDQVEGNVNQLLLPPVLALDNDLYLKPGGSTVANAGAGDDAVWGSESADRMAGGAGNDTLDGGLGVDTAVFSGKRSDYVWSSSPSGVVTITDQRANSPDGTDTLVSVERLQFADAVVPLVPTDLLVVLGAEYFTEAHALAADKAGYLYVAGATNGPVGGAFYSGNTDYFVAKYDLTGRRVWTAIDGSYDLDANSTPYAGGSDIAYAVAAASGGGVYAGGYVNANLHGTANTGDYGTQDGFVTLFNASGERQWSRTLGTAGNDVVYGLASAADGGVYAVGITAGKLADATAYGGDDVFVAKFDASGNRQFLRQFGTSGGDAAYAVAVDAAGFVYVAGETGGALNGSTAYGGQDAFVMKLTASGAPVWTRVFGTVNRELVRAITVADDGSIYVAGDSEGPMAGAPSQGGNDAFLSKFTAAGEQLWTRLAGSTAQDRGFAVATSGDGKVYLGGWAQGDVNGQPKHAGTAESLDGLVVAYSPQGVVLSTELVGTANNEGVYALARGGDGQVYAAGATNGDLGGDPNLETGYAAFVKSVADTPPPPIAGMVYQWKTHALMSDVHVTAASAPRPGAQPSLFEVRAPHLTDASHIEAQLWLNPGAAVEDFLVDLTFESGVTASFTLNTLPGWTVLPTLLPDPTAAGLSLGGFANDAAHAVAGPVLLGTLLLDLPTGARGSALHLDAGAAGAQTLDPYSLSMALATTNANGDYAIDLTSNGTYSLQASKALTPHETDLAITAADALAALKIAVGRNPNADGMPVSPYQFIAADVNGDNKVTSADALGILKMAVKRPDAPQGSWLFVDENQDFWNESLQAFTTTRKAVDWNNNPVVDNTQTGTHNLVAVLQGDVNGSWTAPDGSTHLEDLHPGYFTDLATRLGVPVSQWGVLAA